MLIDFDNMTEPFYLAMCFPYSYQEQQEYLASLEKRMTGLNSIYFKREHFTNSYEGRRVDLLTISSNDRMEKGCTEALTHPCLFPSTENQSTAQLFKADKKVVLLTARVHPGETPSSYAIQGAIDMLTDANNPIARELLNLFVFKVVPMINPDGVSRGHFRTDCHLQDLNRYYDDPTPQMHSTVFAIKQLLSHLDQKKRICFFSDYHSHGLPRNCYFYGNFLKYQLQVESKTFAKLMELTCPEFTASDCDFSHKSMGFKTFKKDRQVKTKAGCSRVAAFRSTMLIHCFTLEIGYHGLVNRNPGEVIEDNNNSNDSCSDMDLPVSTVQKSSNHSYFTTDCYYRVGRNLLEALLDLYGKHPASPLGRSEFKNIENIRTSIAEKIKKDYVKTEQHVESKMRSINQLIEDHYNQKGFQRLNEINEYPKDSQKDGKIRKISQTWQNFPALKQEAKSKTSMNEKGITASRIVLQSRVERKTADSRFANTKPVFENKKASLVKSNFIPTIPLRDKLSDQRKSKDLPSLNLIEKSDITSIVKRINIKPRKPAESHHKRTIKQNRKSNLQIVDAKPEILNDAAIPAHDVNLKIITPKVALYDH